MKSAEDIAREALQHSEKPPCGCCEDHDGVWWQSCDCGNSGDLASAAQWCETQNNLKRVAAALRAYGNERVEKAAKVADQEEEAWRSEAKASKYPDDSITCERYGYVSWGIARRIRAFIEKEPGA